MGYPSKGLLYLLLLLELAAMLEANGGLAAAGVRQMRRITGGTGAESRSKYELQGEHGGGMVGRRW